jgi:hypothetical protein
MSFAASVYDVFAYTLPGILYIYVGNEVLKLIGGSYLTYQDFTSSAVTVLILFVAFIVGHQMDFLADIWRTPKKTKTSSTMAIEELKGLYPHLKIDFRPHDRAILFAIIRRFHGEIAATIDNNKAISVLFQNVSLGFFLYSIVLGIKLFAEGFAAANLLLLIVVIILSFLARQRSKLFNLWFNSLIFETALTYGTSTNKIIRQTQSVSNKKIGIERSDSAKKRGKRDE